MVNKYRPTVMYADGSCMSYGVMKSQCKQMTL
jgi:hypothetical protein